MTIEGYEGMAKAIAGLRDVYPRQEFPDRSVTAYARMLSDLEPDAVERAIGRLVGRSAWIPAISEIRWEVADERLQLPTAQEAWSMVTAMPNINNRDALPNIVRQSLDAMGGRFSIMHSERGETIRAQFIRDYQSRRDQAMLVATGASARIQQGVVKELPSPSLAALPVSEEIQPRPVWARWLRRQDWMMPPVQDAFPSPTEAEKHDAIDVLQADGWGVQALFDEAQRILDDASVEVWIELPKPRSKPTIIAIKPGACPVCGNTSPTYFDNVEDQWAWCYQCQTHAINPRWIGAA